MPSRADFIKISKTRLAEVKVLYDNGYYDGAKYLAGYVIETALKARICKILNSNYPDSGEISRSFLTHKLDNLISLGGLRVAFDNLLAANVDFKTNWSIITNWTETSRYNSIGSATNSEISDLLLALEDRNNGVLTWIKKKW